MHSSIGIKKILFLGWAGHGPVLPSNSSASGHVVQRRRVEGSMAPGSKPSRGERWRRQQGEVTEAVAAAAGGQHLPEVEGGVLQNLLDLVVPWRCICLGFSGLLLPPLSISSSLSLPTSFQVSPFLSLGRESQQQGTAVAVTTS
jgi:hypothetical protein